MFGKRAKALLAAVLTGALAFGASALPASSQVQATDTGLRVYDLTCEYLQDPEAVDEAAPLLSWKLDAAVRDISQTSYRIMAATSEEKLAAGDYDAWDSGRVDSNRTTAIPYEGKRSAATDYYWKVKAWDNQGGSAESQAAKFGVGLLTPEDWDGASFITSERSQAMIDAGEAVADYTLEYKFKVEHWATGVIFGARDKQNFNMWQVNISASDQKVRFNPHVSENGGLRQIESVDVSAVIPWSERNDEHVMRVEVTGPTVVTFIDGQQVDSRNIPVQSFGLIGFRHGTGDGNTSEKGSYDYIKAVDKAGKALFNAEFTDPNASGFDLGERGSVSDGWLTVSYKDGDVVWQTNLEEGEIDPSAVQNYTVEWKYTLEQGATGVIFGGRDKKNFLMWQMSADEGKDQEKLYFRPHIWKNGGASCIDNIDISAAIPWSERNSPHVMRIEVEGERVVTYIDDKLIDTRTVELSGYGLLGFRHGYSTAPERGSVDYIKATTQDGTVLFSDDFDDPMNVSFTGGIMKDGMLQVGYDRGGELCFQNLPTTSLMRKGFATEDKEIVRAKIYASALGIYEMYVNGRRVGDDYFAPGWTDYNVRVQYQGYDVTDLVKKGGDNVWGVMVAPGWFSGKIGLTSQTYDAGTAFIGRMVIDYADGSSASVVTDSTWKYTDPFLTNGDNIDGETYDAGKELGGSLSGFSTAAVSDADWQNAYIRYKNADDRNLVAQIDPPVRITGELPAKKVWEKDGRLLVDFGQNFAGVIRVNVKAAPGTKLRFRYGEALEADGELDTRNLRDAVATDYYIVGTSGQGTYQPRFTFHGFRYAEITGMDAADLTEADIVGLPMNSDLTMTSSFESSSDMVNQLFSNVLYSQRSNYISVPTDCPQRDERRGYTGDAQVFVRAGSYNMDSVAFYRKFLTDVRDAQRSDGAITDVAPTIGFGHAGNPAWADGGIICPWTIYRQYGDVRILLENYGMMEKYMDFLFSKQNNYILSHGIYGDWLCVGENTEPKLMQTAYYGYVASLMSRISQVLLDETDDRAYNTKAQKYEDLFQKIKEAFNKSFVKADGTVDNGSQAAYVLALAFDLLDEDMRQAAADKLADSIRRRGTLTVGFTAISRLCPTLSRYGHSDVAYMLLTNTQYPSWGYSIEQGATTIWERWDSCLPGGVIDYSDDKAGMNSLNHYAFGSIVEWMFSNMLGIEQAPDAAGFQEFVLQPEPYQDEARSMTYAKGVYESIHGPISSDWSFDQNGDLVYKASVPANTTATLYLPVEEDAVVYEGAVPAKDAKGVTYKGYEGGKAVYTLQSGSYTFAMQPADSTVERVTVSANMSFAVSGKNLQLSAKVIGSGNVGQQVSWSVSGGKEGTAVTADGLLTLASDETAETLTVTAASAVAPEISGSLTLAIYPQGDLDQDRKATIADVMEACKVLARKSAEQKPSAAEIALGDLDGDGDVTIADVMEVCKLLARQS